MATPGYPSGTYSYGITNAGLIYEAFDRIQMRGPELTRHHFISARQSLAMALISWSNRGINLWRMTGGTIDLAAGQELYAVPPSTVTLTEVWYSQPDGTQTTYLTDGYGNLILNSSGQPIVTAGGSASGNNTTDRLLAPVTREQYAAIPNKYQVGTPTQYWFQRLAQPALTLWQVPSVGAPTYVLRWLGLQQIMDANVAGGETPNVVNRGLDALAAEMAWRLAVKFGDNGMVTARKADANEAWEMFAANDTERGPVIMRPNLAPYARMRR